ncbi:MAG TPA: alpha/beta fold hydrolase [Gaiellaceae bacterium]|nr:alpha/beta fold hydrolase [Gaiellaceae bacterium]
MLQESVPDERVQAAVAHWAPRFVTQGVDPNDFARVTATVRSWDEWLPAWVADGHRHARLAQEAEEQGRTLTAGEAWNRAALAYHFAKFVWLVDMDLYHEALRLSVAALQNAHRLLDPTAERLEIPCGELVMAATLRRPDGVSRAPLALLLPGLDSTKEEFYEWENVFLRRGLATLSLDGPGQGETGVSSALTHAYEVPVAAALDFLAGRDDVDADRVGVVGVSLGGYYAPRAAAFEPRLRAAAGVSGPYRFASAWDTIPKPTKEMIRNRTRAADDDEARERAALLDLAGVAERIEQPLLVVTGMLDRLVPWEDTKRIADEAPNSTWVLYEDGNHVCNNLPYRYRPLVADWLSEQLR